MSKLEGISLEFRGVYLREWLSELEASGEDVYVVDVAYPGLKEPVLTLRISKDELKCLVANLSDEKTILHLEEGGQHVRNKTPRSST